LRNGGSCLQAHVCRLTRRDAIGGVSARQPRARDKGSKRPSRIRGHAAHHLSHAGPQTRPGGNRGRDQRPPLLALRVSTPAVGSFPATLLEVRPGALGALNLAPASASCSDVEGAAQTRPRGSFRAVRAEVEEGRPRPVG
jgi:hypothetical protein